MVVTDSGMKGRVKGLLGVPAPGEPGAPMEVPTQAAAQQQALQVLTLAQRTAEDHLNSARREADRIVAEARDAAEQVVREAQNRNEVRQREAEKALADARAAAAKIAKDAQAHAEGAKRAAQEMLSDARAQADEIAKTAQADADELQQLAQQRYDDVVGSLATRREGLQRQIEALEQFDRDYRARLQAFMQAQMRALWAEEPKVDPDNLPEGSVPVQREGSEQLART
jgi:cell division septum initiation protein DivIVA